ncbi:MAG TPA: prenyltransferase/squalene oxidase repeat-containing protein [Chthonomonadaceae bacterium]|nr:prenyltransferase/squalene oxidase repeat-containing protein [Chthonomonadaceae bacterium]
MLIHKQRTLFLLPALLAAAWLTAPVGSTHAAPPDPVKVKARQAVARGLAYLRRVQEADGSWSAYPATTALAVSAFLRNGRTEVSDPAVAKGVQYILHAAKPNGAIYSDANPATALPNYNTALCMMALTLTRNPAYKPTIRKAQQYLEKLQFDEEEGITPANPMYGGIGYGSHPDRPDLSNLQMALEALKESGTPSSAPVWQKAIIFLQRVQNRRESNDQPWAKEGSNDGGFLYDSQGRSFAQSGGEHASYGSMTYAGLKSYIYCGVTRSDPRAQAAWNWIRGHYTVTEHPGMGNTSLYYYYHTMAKTLDVYGQKIVQDVRGNKHDWSRDLAAQLVAIQRPDGSWYNDNARFWENQPPLVTSYTLIALSYCLKH